MRRPPPISRFRRCPATAATAALAVIVTGLATWHGSYGVLDMSYLAFHGQPWRLVTSALPHVGILHLLFNVYWLWVFGTLIEEHFGWLRTAGLYILLAASSAAAEYAVMSRGVGLSGVGYGLFAMLWVLERRDRRFRDAVDANTIITFVAWFFLCIFLTVRNIMPIANVAHASGAAMGALVGCAVVATKSLRAMAIGALALALALTFWGATAGRPLVNISPDGARDLDELGYEALVHNENSAALRYFQAATKLRHASSYSWYNLGIAYQRSGDYVNAYSAFVHAAKLDPGSTEFSKAASEMKEYLRSIGRAAAELVSISQPKTHPPWARSNVLP